MSVLRKPLFRGKDYADQLIKIIGVLGYPSEEDFKCITDDSAKQFVKNLRKYERVEWNVLIPDITTDEISLLDGMLSFDPSKRMTIDEILENPVFAKAMEKVKKREEKTEEVFILDWKEQEIKEMKDAQIWIDKELKDAQKLREERLKM